jgi:hypothetical protein
VSIADGQHDLEVIFYDPDGGCTKTWAVSVSTISDEQVAAFLAKVASGLVHYSKVEEDDDWLR